MADLSFNQQTPQASRAGMPLELNPTQRKLLELLMKSSPAVVKRDRLEELIWGDLAPRQRRVAYPYLQSAQHHRQAVLEKSCCTRFTGSATACRTPDRFAFTFTLVEQGIVTCTGTASSAVLFLPPSLSSRWSVPLFAGCLLLIKQRLEETTFWAAGTRASGNSDQRTGVGRNIVPCTVQ